MRRKRQHKEFWMGHYQSYLQSGLTQRAYCQENDLGYWTFNQWKRRLEKTSDAAIQEIPVHIFKNKQTEINIEILIKDTIKISVPEDCFADSLKKIFTVMEELQ